MAAIRIPKSVRTQKLKMCPFCAVCGTTADLEINHFDPKGQPTIDNLIVLCSKHHMVWHDVKSKSRHADLTREKIQEAIASGVQWGKKPFDHEKVMRLIAENSTQFVDIYDPDVQLRTESEIMEMAGVKSVCYHKCKRMLLDAMALEAWPYSWPKPKKKRNMPLYDHVVRELRGEGRSEP